MYEGRTAAEAGITFGRYMFFRNELGQDGVFVLADNHEGHENMGIIEQVGHGVTLLKKGDRVVMPFNVADGRCRNCEEGKTAFCTGVNPGFAGGAYGTQITTFFQNGFQSLSDWLMVSQATLPWVHTVEVSTPPKGYSFPSPKLTHERTGQAQFIRVPYADFNALKLPPGKEFESDFILLAGEFMILPHLHAPMDCES